MSKKTIRRASRPARPSIVVTQPAVVDYNVTICDYLSGLKPEDFDTHNCDFAYGRKGGQCEDNHRNGRHEVRLRFVRLKKRLTTEGVEQALRKLKLRPALACELLAHLHTNKEQIASIPNLIVVLGTKFYDSCCNEAALVIFGISNWKYYSKQPGPRPSKPRELDSNTCAATRCQWQTGEAYWHKKAWFAAVAISEDDDWSS
jgi:hypothetical protein